MSSSRSRNCTGPAVGDHVPLVRLFVRPDLNDSLDPRQKLALRQFLPNQIRGLRRQLSQIGDRTQSPSPSSSSISAIHRSGSEIGNVRTGSTPT